MDMNDYILVNNYFNKNIYWVYSSRNGDGLWYFGNRYSEQIEELYKIYIESKTNNKITHNNWTYSSSKFVECTTLDISNLVDFSNLDTGKNIKNEPINMKILTPSPINDVKIGHMILELNFDTMEQRNKSTTDKTRKIRRLEIPEKIDNIYQYLKDNNVIGIYGIKF